MYRNSDIILPVRNTAPHIQDSYAEAALHALHMVAFSELVESSASDLNRELLTRRGRIVQVERILRILTAEE